MTGTLTQQVVRGLLAFLAGLPIGRKARWGNGRWQEMTITELMKQFEKDYPSVRKDKEPKDMWPKGICYQSLEANALFLVYRNGYVLGVRKGE